jgi:hypothetical protein
LTSPENHAMMLEQPKPPVPMEIIDELNTKSCVYCNETKKLSEFPGHRGHKDRHDTRCRTCISEQSKLRYQLKKTAPPKPDVCDLCGKIPPHNKKIVLDHCHKTGKFRGWICDPCNVGLGNLGDNLSGLYKAVEYLKTRS